MAAYRPDMPMTMNQVIHAAVRRDLTRLDRALADCPGVRSVVVVPQVARPVPWVPGRDLWWHEALDHDLPPLPEPPGWEPGPEGAGTAPRTLGA